MIGSRQCSAAPSAAAGEINLPRRGAPEVFEGLFISNTQNNLYAIRREAPGNFPEHTYCITKIFYVTSP